MAKLSGALRRDKAQIYFDVLRVIYSATKAGQSASMYRVERLSGLTHSRLRTCLKNLDDSGLIEEGMKITPQGYEFMSEVAHKVRPVLEKYGLWHSEP